MSKCRPSSSTPSFNRRFNSNEGIKRKFCEFAFFSTTSAVLFSGVNIFDLNLDIEMLSSSEIDQLLKQEGYAPSDFGDLESQMEQWERELGLSPASEVTTQDTKQTTSKAEEPKVEESKVTKGEATTAQKVDKAARRDLDKSKKSPKPATETKTQHHGQQPPACPKTQSDRHAPENVDKAGTNKQIFKNIPQISYPEQKEPVLPPEILRLREAAKESQRRRLAAKAQANAENAKNAKTTSSLAAQKQNSGDDSTEVRNAKRLNTVSSTRPHRLCIKGKNVAAAALEAANQERAKDIQTIRISARNSIIISSSRGSGSSSHAMSLNVQSQPQPLVTKRGVKRSAATQENDIPTNTPESCRAERPVKRPNIPHHIRCETTV